MNAPDWLTARPIAHRGLHDRKSGLIENSAAAAKAAIAGGFAIECDVQLTADGEAMVFHDFNLDRLTGQKGPLAGRTAAELGGIELTGSHDRVLTLAEFLALIDGRAPLVCEIKSAFDGDMRLATRTAAVARGYAGQIALKSFDPAVLAHLRGEAATLGIVHIPVGLVAEARYQHGEWLKLSPDQVSDMTALTHWRFTRPDFLSWRVDDLPHAAPSICRAMKIPVMCWTVRRPDQIRLARAFADQIVFEGFAP
jgi:glycerophosphoryl diester phosphodiesterase